MKRVSILFFSCALVLGVVGAASATPITFNLAGASGGSSAVATGTPGGFWSGYGGDITATLAPDLDSQIFTLGDSESHTIDFFTLTTTGTSWRLEDYTIAATLAFDTPNIAAAGSGDGIFSTLFGAISGGTLQWDPSTLPDAFTVLGHSISVDFESGSALGFGNTAMVHATITNNGGGPAPVPEPATILLLGTGMAGVAVARQRKAKKYS